MKKVIAVIFVLFIFLILCTGCFAPDTSDEKYITTAKVRYFDGSMDTLEIDRFIAYQSGLVRLYFKDGSTMYLGINNVIIIKETEEQYNH